MNVHSIARNQRDNPHNILDEIVYRWSPRSMNGQALTEEDHLSLFEAASEYLALGDEHQVNFMAAAGNTAPEVEAQAISHRKEMDEIAIAL